MYRRSSGNRGGWCGDSTVRNEVEHERNQRGRQQRFGAADRRADGGAALAAVSADVRGALDVARQAVLWSRADLTLHPALVNGAAGMVAAEHRRRRFAQSASEANAVPIEGGLGLCDGNPSAADLAREFFRLIRDRDTAAWPA